MQPPIHSYNPKHSTHTTVKGSGLHHSSVGELAHPYTTRSSAGRLLIQNALLGPEPAWIPKALHPQVTGLALNLTHVM